VTEQQAEPEDPEQGREWVDFIAKQLDREYELRDLINSRSAGAITSASALVTASLAVIAIVKGEHFTVAGAFDVWLLIGALAFLLGAAVLSIRAGAARGRYLVADVSDMNKMLSADKWGIDNIDARHDTAELNVLAICTLRIGNKVKYRSLMRALTSQAIGVVLLAIFAVVVIAR
jgi:hypothetical protein